MAGKVVAVDVTAAGSVEWHEQDAAGVGTARHAHTYARLASDVRHWLGPATAGVLAGASLLHGNLIRDLTTAGASHQGLKYNWQADALQACGQYM